MTVGILGIGTYLPPEVRRNDWWSDEVVARWRVQQAQRMDALRRAPAMPTEGMQRVVGATLALDGDPFEGAVTRHVLGPEQTSLEMERAAAEDAIARAGIDRGAIDLLLSYPAVPDYLLSNTACELHHRLGLASGCLALETNASAYSFLAQLALAVPMIASGRVRHALLVQSAAISRLIDPGDPVAARVGDAATAVVVGPVADGYGVLGDYHRTDGRSPRTLIATVPGARWYDGKPTMQMADPDGARRVFLGSVDQAKESVDGALAAAGRSVDAVDFLAVHHATPWVGAVVGAHAGLARARTADLFPTTAYVFAASIPLILAAGERAGALGAGDLAMLVGAGPGMMYGATVLRWGGRPS